ncbi:MAG TPA: murein L,D-transpeptidase catalytic domain family protein [Chryseosolibacter sp.]|nr:murein L,D-transpeptidase catalytic domain family protein [Chryseosolibacter sp.]
MKYLTLSLLLVCLSTVGGSLFSKAAFDRKNPEVHAVSEKAVMTAVMYDDSLRALYHAIGLEKYDLPFDIFRYGMIGYHSLEQDGKLSGKGLLSIIDFTKPSTRKRFYTIDLNRRRVVFHTYVSHGRNTGENYATAFSNKPHSNQSSLGFYVTGETYVGSKGYSMKLDGMDRGYNDKIRDRAVVMHEADYVSENWIKRYGRLGRSQGCPALSKEMNRKVIDTIKGKSLIFAYYNDGGFLRSSANLDLQKVLNGYNTGIALASK